MRLFLFSRFSTNWQLISYDDKWSIGSLLDFSINLVLVIKKACCYLVTYVLYLIKHGILASMLATLPAGIYVT